MKRLPIHPLLLSRLVVLFFLLTGEYGYFIAEDSLVLRLTALLLGLVSAMFLLIRRRVSFPVLLAFYLNVVAIGNWYFVTQSSLLWVLIWFSLIQLPLSYILCLNEGVQLRGGSAPFLLFGLLGQEVLLLYTFYLISPIAIGLCMLSYFYVLWGILLLREQEGLGVRQVSPYFVLGLLFTFLTLLSAQLAR